MPSRLERIGLAALLAIAVLTAPALQPDSIRVSAGEAVDLPFQRPPAPLDKLLDAPASPAISVSPDKKSFLLLEQQAYPALQELAEPELKLAGMRINPGNTAPSRSWSYVGLSLQRIDGTKVPVSGLPARASLGNLSWSPDSRYVAFTQTDADSVDLWLLDAGNGKARSLGGLSLNRANSQPFVWDSDSRSLIVKRAPEGKSPPLTQLPAGPSIMESSGQPSPGRTYQDLLRNTHDVALFRHFFTGRLMRVDLAGKAVPLGQPGLIYAFDPSPDGRYLLVRRWHEPFSYAFPAGRFPVAIELWDSSGKLLRTLADLPLADKIPIHFDAVRPGPRLIDWRADAPATLWWAEALDGGDPGKAAEHRDKLMLLPAPFDKPAKQLFQTPLRIETVYWGRGDLALIQTGWYQNRREEIWHLQPEKAAAPKKLLAYSSEDRYALPGSPLTHWNAQGRSVLQLRGDEILLSGDGASAEGDRPFLDALNPFTGKSQRLWRSAPPMFERPVSVLDPNAGTLLLRRESLSMPPNYFFQRLGAQPRALTNIPDPFPEIRQVTKQTIDYVRADGVKLSGTLYLPPGSKKGQPLPLVMWAYPREFKSSQAAGQVKGSPHSFVRLSPSTPLVFLTQGYAVLDDPAMPIVGEGDQEPNDNFREQLVSSAQAAVDKVVSMGVAERGRIAIGGHSYGAYMTVNLLAHSRLFAAGIARSGAYNRTLTPFGFQGEQRSLWQAPQVYTQMSPFLYADKIKDPLLLIHGEADDNPGTYPMQSQNLYAALKGLGGRARLVMLPYESHGYRARESLGHMLWEMVTFLDKHLKKK